VIILVLQTSPYRTKLSIKKRNESAQAEENRTQCESKKTKEETERATMVPF
jgi:hypothetical protein